MISSVLEDGHNVLRRSMVHKLIVGSSTTLQILATLHKLLPVHPLGHMLGVHIFDVGET